MKTLIKCGGLTVGKIWVPPFQLKVGEVVCFQMPCLACSDEEKQIVRAITGQSPFADLQLFGKAIWAEPEKGFPDTFFQRLQFRFFRPRFSTWLEKVEGFTREQTRTVLERHEVGWDWRLGSIPWTSRNLIALETAWIKGADIVVFSTIALDREGLESVYGEVEKHLHHSAAIELSYAYWSAGQQKRNGYAGATCLDLTLKTSELHSLAGTK